MKRNSHVKRKSNIAVYLLLVLFTLGLLSPAQLRAEDALAQTGTSESSEILQAETAASASSETAQAAVAAPADLSGEGSGSVTRDMPAVPITVSVQISNTAVSTEEGAPWEGWLAGSESDGEEVSIERGQTAKDALIKLADEKGLELQIKDSLYGPYLSSVNGFGEDSAESVNRSWVGWIYTVNGSATDENGQWYPGIGTYQPKNGDLLHFYVSAAPKVKVVKVSIINELLSKEQGAAWTGDLFGESSVPVSEAVTKEVSLPSDATAADVLKALAEDEDINVVTSGEGENIWLKSINGLGENPEGSPYESIFWAYKINGKLADKGIGSCVPADSDTLSFYLEKWGADPEDPDEKPDVNPDQPKPNVLDAFWPSFRGNEENLAVRPAGERSPLSAAEVKLCWQKNYSPDPTTWIGLSGQPVVVNNRIYLVHGNVLEMLNPENGESLASAKLPGNQGYGSTPPLYADGYLFVPLDKGTLAAYNAETLDLLWTWQDPNDPAEEGGTVDPTSGRGQTQSPLSYKDGVVLVSFWNYDGKGAYLRALDAAGGKSLWEERRDNGWYWAGGIISGDYFIQGNEDNEIVIRNYKTGAITDTIGTNANVRSTVIQYKGVFYVADTSGSLYRFEVNDAGKAYNVSTMNVGTAVTATPAAYNDRLYVAAGIMSEDGSSSYVYNVIDLASDSWKKVRTITLPAYPQGSPLVLTDEDGTAHVYVTANGMPGALYMFTDAPGETGDAEAEAVYTPPEAYQNYNLSSPILLPDGKILYRNDSGAVFALCKEAAPAPTTTPSEETEPAEPSAPSRPTAPSEEKTLPAGTEAAKGEVAKTGEDGSKLVMAVVLLGAAIVLIIVLVILKRKESSDGQDRGHEDDGPSGLNGQNGPKAQNGPSGAASDKKDDGGENK